MIDFATRIPLTGCGSWRHLPTTANGQPAVASYLWDDAAGAHLAWSIDVLTVGDDRIAGSRTCRSRPPPPLGLPVSLA